METKGGHGIDDSLQTEVVVLSRILSSQNFHFTREAKVVVSSPPNAVVFAEYFFADFPPSTKNQRPSRLPYLDGMKGAVVVLY